MVTHQILLEFVKAEPFRPFRLRLADGRTLDVRHPEMVKVLRSYLILFKSFHGGAELSDEWESVSLELAESVSCLESPVRSLTIHEEGPAMIISKKLHDYVAAEPFRPFRMSMASGQSFDIRHPEMILVGRTSVRVYTVTGSDQNEKWHDVSLMLMETVEPLDAPIHQSSDS